jgi:hypothetical protein
MNNRRELGETVTWLGAIAGGAWLSVKVAQCVVDCMSAVADVHPREPVREVVEEMLAEHQADDTPIVKAFEEALEEKETERNRTAVR